MIADVAAISGLLIGGGRAIVWAGSFGALVAGGYIVWTRWGHEVDRMLVAGIAIAVAGAGVFGFSLGDAGSGGSPRDAGASAGASSATATTEAPSMTATTTATTTATSTSQPSTTTQVVPAGPPTYLADLQPTSDGMLPGEWRVADTLYHHSLGARDLCAPNDVGTATYALGGSYGRFQATIGATPDMDEDDDMIFVVELDGDEIARRPVTPAQPATIDVPVSGGDELRLTVTDDGGCIFRGTAVWGDARLVP